MTNRIKIIVATIGLLLLIAGYGLYRNNQVNQRQTDEKQQRVEQNKTDQAAPQSDTDSSTEANGEVNRQGQFGDGERDYSGSGTVAVTADSVLLNTIFTFDS